MTSCLETKLNSQQQSLAKKYRRSTKSRLQIHYYYLSIFKILKYQLIARDTRAKILTTEHTYHTLAKYKNDIENS